MQLLACAPPASPLLGALKWKPSGIPSAAIVRSQCFSQFQLSFFRRRVGTPPLRRKSLHAAHFLIECGNGDRSLIDRSRFSDLSAHNALASCWEIA